MRPGGAFRSADVGLNGQCSTPVSKALVAPSVTDEVAKRVPDLLTFDPTDRFCDGEPWLARELKACAQGASSCPAL